MIRHFIALLGSLAVLHAGPEREPDFSRAGFYTVPDSGRSAADFNVGWRFHRGNVEEAEARDFNDRAWQQVCTPHGVDGALPEETSGSSNYQGPAWYRKTFTPPTDLTGKRVSLHFEGILGKSKIWVNGKLMREHFSGFLPAIVDITEVAELGKPNVVAVLADNSDDPSYPPGKPQKQLDYSYLGGIYRDVWLVSTNPVHITDPNAVDVVAGGGVFFHTDELDAAHAKSGVQVHVVNESDREGAYTVECDLTDATGKAVASAKAPLKLAAKASGTTSFTLGVKNPAMWTPDSPVLHNLVVRVKDREGKVIDARRNRVGLRTIAFTHEKGFILNGQPFPEKLIGGNRHQDHAVIGFALSNNLHWRDALKLREAGFRVVRNAHYPQDPAFMDACDELGLFVIVNTPGWQFWNKDPIFGERVYSDIRNMVRRDRNHASVLLWEPILNETSYPAEFAKNAHDINHAEYPWPGCYTAADSEALGHEHFEVLYAHPRSGDGLDIATNYDKSKVYFTREWGDNVDDWGAQNSPSRVSLGWGEVPQLVQAKHYAKPSYPYSCLDSLFRAGPEHFGGTMWHSFDHQRGYHLDPFLGGIMDAFRRPKFSYELFKAQRPVKPTVPGIESGPTVFVANAMTPFSQEDVTVYSNCDSVRLSVNGKVFGEKKVPFAEGTKSHIPMVTFENAFHFMEAKKLSRAFKPNDVQLVAEGIVDGKVVCTHVSRPAQVAVRIDLSIDNAGQKILADGSTVVPVMATLVDKNGTPKRLNNGSVAFEVTGAGELIGDVSVGANPRALKWGDAPALVRVGAKPGKVRIVARFVPAGAQMPQTGVLEFETAPAPGAFVQDEIPEPGHGVAVVAQGGEDTVDSLRLKLETSEKELNRLRNREVERQQTEFENTK
ncbi:glycoside hydrolase family 2 TIM barrel-domain containing protein [Luteolibacter sp. LG18]|uniref:glycoside hydrolase family 2 protein n=1 Tax=Luteolibacter sp. LG18 TaxID=2819286 RepID=UPI002B3164FC|nr:beta-galactosidase [Luteolibacter sp. LG18]